MDDANGTNECTPSTTWAWRQVRIRPAPQAEEHRPSGARTLRSLIGWPPRKVLSVRIKYRGGPECWWEIEARGVTIRRPGSLALHDVLADFYGGTIR